MKLHDYQQEMVDFALQTNGNIYAAPGLGKTLASLSVIKHRDVRTLVVAPRLVCENTWPRENKKWGFDFEIGRWHGGKIGNEQITLVNYERLPQLAAEIGVKSRGAAFPFEQIVYDEISKMKNPGTSRFGNWRHQMNRAEYRFGLSGTPTGNSLLGVWGQMYAVDIGASLGRRYTDYKNRYFYKEIGTNKTLPVADAEKDIFDKIAGRAVSFDVDRLDMPPLVENLIPIELPKKALDTYIEMGTFYTVERMNMVAVNNGVRAGKLRQIASGAVYDTDGVVHRLHYQKREVIRNIIDELQGSPSLIVYDYGHSLEPILDVLKGLRVGVLNGGTTDAQARQILHDWNEGLLDHMVIHPASAGHGLNIQGIAANIIMYDVPWSFELFLQALMRVWRQGEDRTVIAHYLFVKDTVEESVVDKKSDNEDMHKRFMRRFSHGQA